RAAGLQCHRSSRCSRALDACRGARYRVWYALWILYPRAGGGTRKRACSTWIVMGTLVLSGVVSTGAFAFDPEAEFAKGTTIVGVQIGGGVQNNIADDSAISGISFLNVTPRLSHLPFEPFGSGWLRSAIEPGLEGWFQYYLEPRVFTAAGLKAALRYHLLGVGPLVPYLDVTAGAGGTNLNVPE